MKTIVFIDGENFQKKAKQAVRALGRVWDDRQFAKLNLTALINNALVLEIDAVHYYAAKLHVYEETREKSEQLVGLQRALKTNLEKQAIKFIVSGNVRMFRLGGGQLVFKEKGVDVRLAVDAVSFAADQKLDVAVICSSDSDMQPVVSELRRRGVRVIYLGFQVQPNKGLIFTCDQTSLLRNDEVSESIRFGFTTKP